MKFASATILCFCCLSAISQYSEQVQIYSPQQIDSTREAIRQYVFGDEEIPQLEMDFTANKLLNVFAKWYSDNHLGGFETGTIRLKNGFTSKVCFFHPVKSNGLKIPIIYHTGHAFGMLQEDLYVNYAISDAEHVKVIDFFLARGFEVVGIDMPFYGMNAHPTTVTERGMTMPMYGHNDFFNLAHPFYYFLAPVRAVVDFLQSNKGYNDIVMLGLSGGGWTTTVYSAMDTRITLSFPIAGSIPLPLRTSDNERGDLEQYLPDFYDRFNYSTLYFLGSAGEGRRQYQILNKYDHCCFRLDGNGFWVDSVQAKIRELNGKGSYGFYLDTLPHTHRISPVAADSIHRNIVRFLANEKLKNMVSVVSSKQDNIICEGEDLILSIVDSEANEVEWHAGGPEKYSEDASVAPTIPGDFYAHVMNISGAEAYSDTVEVNQAKQLKKPQISLENGRLHSSFDGESRWWKDNELLPDTGEYITPNGNGMFVVRSLAGNCESELSDPFVVGLRVYQENSSSALNVQVDSQLGNVQYALYNASGMLLEKGNINGFKRIDLTGQQAAGIYFIKFSSNKINTIKKVVIR